MEISNREGISYRSEGKISVAVAEVADSVQGTCQRGVPVSSICFLLK